jgi:hypothetical protein
MEVEIIALTQNQRKSIAMIAVNMIMGTNPMTPTYAVVEVKCEVSNRFLWI